MLRLSCDDPNFLSISFTMYKTTETGSCEASRYNTQPNVCAITF